MPLGLTTIRSWNGGMLGAAR